MVVLIVRGILGCTALRYDLVKYGLEFLRGIHLLLMSDLKYALVFKGHLLLILWRIIVSCFICVRTHLITIIGDIQFVVVRALKILLLRNLILIILDIFGLVIDGIFSHQGIIRDHAPVPLVKLLDPSPLLHLLLLLHLKHLGQIQ